MRGMIGAALAMSAMVGLGGGLYNPPYARFEDGIPKRKVKKPRVDRRAKVKAARKAANRNR